MLGLPVSHGTISSPTTHTDPENSTPYVHDYDPPIFGSVRIFWIGRIPETFAHCLQLFRLDPEFFDQIGLHRLRTVLGKPVIILLRADPIRMPLDQKCLFVLKALIEGVTEVIQGLDRCRVSAADANSNVIV